MTDGVREIIAKRIAKKIKCGKPIKGAFTHCGRPKKHWGECDWQPLNIDWALEEIRWREGK